VLASYCKHEISVSKLEIRFCKIKVSFFVAKTVMRKHDIIELIINKMVGYMLELACIV